MLAEYHPGAMRQDVTPPQGSKFVFMGCGKSDVDVIDIDAVFLEGTKLLYKI